MPIFECNENQFVENIRRLLESKQQFVVNRRIRIHDDYNYGFATLPDQVFEKYSMICDRKGFRQTVYAKVPFVDNFHDRFYYANEAVHNVGKLNYPAISIPYYKVEYSFNIWGSTYLHTLDVLFNPNIVIGKKVLTARLKKKVKTDKSSMLLHILTFDPPDEKMSVLNLPNQVIIFDVKNMSRVFDL